MNLFKMFFWFFPLGLDGDPGSGGGDPDPSDPGNDPNPDPGNDPDPNDPDPSPTFVEVNGVKIPEAEFEKIAQEKYKDRFEAYDNREKWQKENTQKAQQNAQHERDAETYRSIMANPQAFIQQFQPQQPANQSEQFVQGIRQQYPDVDPGFLKAMYSSFEQIAGRTAQQKIDPLVKQQGANFEREFLSKHPDVLMNSPEYNQIGSFIQAGTDPEQAYQFVFRDTIAKQKLDDTIKLRDEDAKRKLKQTRLHPLNGTKLKGKNFQDRSREIIDRMYTE